MVRRVLYSSIVFLVTFTGVKAQLLDSLSYDTATVYTSLETALQLPLEVYKLSLRKDHYRTIPKEIYQFKNLNYLDLGRNQLKTIDSGIAVFKYLQTLNLEKNDLEDLPKEIGQLSNLRKLIISQNKLTQLPIELGNCGKLKLIDLWSNEITKLPLTLNNIEQNLVIDMRVITMNKDEQDELKRLFPGVKFEFSNSCNCK